MTFRNKQESLFGKAYIVICLASVLLLIGGLIVPPTAQQQPDNYYAENTSQDYRQFENPLN